MMRNSLLIFRNILSPGKGNGQVFRSLSTTPADPFVMDRLTGSDEGIVVFRMNRPQTKNAISKQFLQQLRSSLQEIKFDKNARVVILKSEVPGAFCTGADLKERKTMPVEEVPKFVDQLRSSFTDLERLPLPVIAAIDGFALGGGLEMALSCDIRIASKAAKLGLTETKLAIIPGAGGTQRLTRVIGPAKAKELIFTARMIDGNEAQSIGLVNHCVEGSSYDKALEIAREILPRGPVAVRLAKIGIDLGSQMDVNSGFSVEQLCYAQLRSAVGSVFAAGPVGNIVIVPTKDRLEGLKAFAEKRPPVYKGE